VPGTPDLSFRHLSNSFFSQLKSHRLSLLAVTFDRIQSGKILMIKSLKRVLWAFKKALQNKFAPTR
jgi:hypothetical protein